jgi:hypothetical protein
MDGELYNEKPEVWFGTGRVRRPSTTRMNKSEIPIEYIVDAHWSNKNLKMLCVTVVSLPR